MGLTTLLRHEIRDVRYRLAASRPTSKPRIVVYGNCQAAALRKTLEACDSMRGFTFIATPPAHEITSSQVRRMQAVLEKTDVLITQHVRNDYRSLPVGTEQFADLLPPQAQIITYPSMFYRGLHPLLGYVHAAGELGTAAPITGGYHDLRFIFAAALGLTNSQALAWLADFKPPQEFVQRTAQQSLSDLRNREKDLDIGVSDAIQDLEQESFWTLNHPSNAVIRRASQQVELALGVGPGSSPVLPAELLSSVMAPVQIQVSASLGYPPAQNRDWSVGGERHSEADVLRHHLDFYRKNPHVISRAIEEHGSNLVSAGLGRSAELG